MRAGDSPGNLIVASAIEWLRKSNNQMPDTGEKSSKKRYEASMSITIEYYRGVIFAMEMMTDEMPDKY